MKSPTFYYIGRLLQLIGMFELLVDILTAGPLGPSPRLFTIGIMDFSCRMGANPLDTLARVVTLMLPVFSQAKKAFRVRRLCAPSGNAKL